MNIIKRILSVLLILTIAFSNIIYADGRDTIEDDDYIEVFSFNGKSYGYDYDSDSNYNTNYQGGKNSGTKINEGSITTAGFNYTELSDITYYPYIRMRYKNISSGDTYREAYITSNHISTLPANVIVQVALENPNGFTLGVESMWDGWTKTMTGLSDTNILNNNGQDKNVVVHGGSTAFICTKQSKGIDGTNNSVASKEHLKVQNIGIEGFFVCAPSTEVHKIVSYDYTTENAKDAFENFAKDVEKNLNMYRVEKVVAEGVYLQGQESAFTSAAKTVNGQDQVSTFGSFNGTAGSGNGNKLDRTHNKYYLKNESQDLNNLSVINAKITHKDVDVFTIKSDINTTDLTSILHFDKNGAENFTIKTANTDPSNWDTTSSTKGAGGVKPENKIDYDKIASELKSHKEWDHLNMVTGFVDNYIEALDFNRGNNGKTRNSSSESKAKDATQQGTVDYSNATPRENWYNEGQDGISIVRLQCNIELSLDDYRWEVIDPALCGQAKKSL